VKKLILLLLITFLYGTQVDAQALWGAEANTGQTEGQFGTDFVPTGDPNSLSVDSWTALSIYDSNQATTPGAAYWTRNLQGYSQGAYWSGVDPVSSPSRANGVALFDSDFLDNGGTPGAFGTGTSPSVHRGELISPVFDLMGYTDFEIMLKVYLFYRNFQINNLSISFSTDNGSSWGPEVDMRDYQPEMQEGFTYIPFPTDTLVGVSNLTEVRFKFVFDGDYYFALVDDATVMVYDETVYDEIFADGFDSTSP